MRFPRKLAIGAGAFVLALLLVLYLVPLLFRGRITAQLRAAVANTVNARVDWSSASFGLLRDFPSASLTLHDLDVVGVAPFQSDTLATIRDLRLALDIGSVVGFVRRGDAIVVREITLTEPRLNLRVLADGRANWDIARPSPAGAAKDRRAVGVTLRHLRIQRGTITLDDARSRLALELRGLNETLSGDFARQKLVLSTRTRIDSASLRFTGVPYLSRAAVALDADIDADLAAHRFAFRGDTLRFNELLVSVAGSVTLGKPDMSVDVAFRAPSTAFRDILSLVPAVYASDFRQLQTAGTMSVSGRVRGTYGPRAFPAIALRAKVENGAFRDPSLPLPARRIFLDLAVDNPGGSLDNTVVNLQRLHAEIGGRPLDAHLVVRTPVSDPDVDLRVLGALDLADVARTVKLANVSTLSGLVTADVAMRGRVSDVNAARYDRVTAAGSASVSRVTMRATAMPRAIAVDTAFLRFTPRAAQLTAFAARSGNSDMRATATLDNVIGFAFHGQDLSGSGSMQSKRIDLAELQSRAKATDVIPVPAHVDVSLAAVADKVTYGAVAMNDVRGTLHVKDQRISLDSLHMIAMGGAVAVSGVYDTHDLAHPGFDVALDLDAVDIPSSFAALGTVQKLAPIARWARGSVSGTVAVKGLLAQDMTPVLGNLTGRGDLRTEKLVVQNAPVLEKLSGALSLDQLRSPALGAVHVAFDLADGRVHVKPFDVSVGGMTMTVSGSNGIDESLRYDLALALPRTALGNAAVSSLQNLAAKAGTSATAFAAAQVVKLTAQVAGTVNDPRVSTSFAGMGQSLSDASRTAASTVVSERVAMVKQQSDSAATEAHRRATEATTRRIAEAQQQAAAIRARARALADSTRQQAGVRSDSLVARAKNPAARIAAQVAADRLRKEADEQADRIVREADSRADGVVTQAKVRAGAVPPTSAGTK